MVDYVAFPQALLSDDALPVSCIEEYELRSPLLQAFVDDAMLDVIRREKLIPPDAENMMLNNHQQHVRFMGAAFRLRSPALFTRTLPWVYHAYRNHGFSYDYFLRALSCWKAALQKHLHSATVTAITPIYDWILVHHDEWIRLADALDDQHLGSMLSDRQGELLRMLLAGQHRSALDLMQREVRDPEDVLSFYRDMLQPVMYEIGNRWQCGSVSVAEEHMASAIVSRLMAGMPFVTAPCRSRTPDRAIVSTAHQETHELGAWMIADLLHLKQDWDVRYLGADTPVGDVVAMAERIQPSLIAFSVTMVFHIPRIGRFVHELREREALSQTRVLVGGQAFCMVPELWRGTHADAYASDLASALEQSAKWVREAA